MDKLREFIDLLIAVVDDDRPWIEKKEEIFKEASPSEQGAIDEFCSWFSGEKEEDEE